LIRDAGAKHFRIQKSDFSIHTSEFEVLKRGTLIKKHELLKLKKGILNIEC